MCLEINIIHTILENNYTIMMKSVYFQLDILLNSSQFNHDEAFMHDYRNILLHCRLYMCQYKKYSYINMTY